MPKKQNPPLSKTDLAILSLFWRKGEATGREIFDGLVEKGDVKKSVAYTTVKTYLDRLIRNGLPGQGVVVEASAEFPQTGRH